VCLDSSLKDYDDKVQKSGFGQVSDEEENDHSDRDFEL